MLDITIQLHIGLGIIIMLLNYVVMMLFIFFCPQWLDTIVFIFRVNKETEISFYGESGNVA